MCSLDQCNYKRWSDGTDFGGGTAQARYNDYMDAHLECNNASSWEEEGPEELYNDEEADFGIGGEDDSAFYGIKEFTSEQEEEMHREFWLESRRKQLGADYDSEDMTKSDFEDWEAEQLQEVAIDAEASSYDTDGLYASYTL